MAAILTRRCHNSIPLVSDASWRGTEYPRNTAVSVTVISLSAAFAFHVMMPSPFLSCHPVSARAHQPLSGYPSRCCCVAPPVGGTPPRLTNSLLFVEPLSVTSQPTALVCTSCALMSPSHPQLRTSPRFSKRVVAPVPNEGGSTRLMSA